MKNWLVSALTTCLFKITSPTTLLYLSVHELAKRDIKVVVKVKEGLE